MTKRFYFKVLNACLTSLKYQQNFLEKTFELEGETLVLLDRFSPAELEENKNWMEVKVKQIELMFCICFEITMYCILLYCTAYTRYVL